jgi:multiple inositol-polyphosphate phosphatase / 2,3-bisphosphoglycerate 3-phosphatase
MATRLEALVEEANQKGNSEVHKIPGWIRGWESPWKGRVKGGELIDLGEQELYSLALRVRDRLPEIFSRDYHPDIYPIKATQVSTFSS